MPNKSFWHLFIYYLHILNEYVEYNILKFIYQIIFDHKQLFIYEQSTQSFLYLCTYVHMPLWFVMYK